MKHWECQSCGHDFWAPRADEVCPVCGMKAVEEIITDVITIRDFFAGCALIGFLARGECDDALEAIPHDAYLYADAMIKARQAAQ